MEYYFSRIKEELFFGDTIELGDALWGEIHSREKVVTINLYDLSKHGPFERAVLIRKDLRKLAGLLVTNKRLRNIEYVCAISHLVPKKKNLFKALGFKVEDEDDSALAKHFLALSAPKRKNLEKIAGYPTNDPLAFAIMTKKEFLRKFNRGSNAVKKSPQQPPPESRRE